MTTPNVTPSPPQSWRAKYQVHPCADVFPMISDAELDALAEDIKKNGLRDKIVFWNHGKNPKKIVGTLAIESLARDYVLLDGRNRLAALERLGRSLTVSHMELLEHDVDPAAYVISKNIHRRHLTKEQQAEKIVQTIEAGKIDRATSARSFNTTTGKKGGSTKDPVLTAAVEEGKKHGISKRTVQNARAKLSGKTPAPRKPIGVSKTPPSGDAKPLVPLATSSAPTASTSSEMRVRHSTLGDPGDLHAEPSSRPWAIAMHLRLLNIFKECQSAGEALMSACSAFQKHEGWRQLSDRKGHPFKSWDEFYRTPTPFGLCRPECNPNAIERAIEIATATQSTKEPADDVGSAAAKPTGTTCAWCGQPSIDATHHCDAPDPKEFLASLRTGRK
ncbi:MAG TPA: hypothetical protein VKE96_17435 [Vicinamibacterales bacterium]|nr:hypothetical protein [Vicinamibacterales bacterium]